MTSKNELIKEYKEFLKNHRLPYLDKNDPKREEQQKKLTHTEMGGKGNMGSYAIDGQDYIKFIDLHKKIILNGCDSYIVERSTEIAPYVADIDYKTELDKRQYKQRHVVKLINIYINLFKKYLNISDEDLTSFVFEKPSPSREEKNGVIKYKDGFHILFPNIILDVKQRYFFYDLAKNIAKDDDPFDDISMLEESTIDTIFDSSVIINNGMLMYGARKLNRLPYDLTTIYDVNLETIDKSEYDFSEIFWLTLLRRCSEDDKIDFVENDENEYIEDKLDDVYKKYKKGKNKEVVIDFTESFEKVKNTKTVRTDTDGSEIFRSPTKVVEIAKKMANILSPKRASDYNSWIRVGWALHNIDYSLLDTYIKFSKKCASKYEPGCCEKVWREARDSGLTINSLYWWANEDNPKEYYNILRENFSETLLQAMSGTHDDVASAIFELYKPFYKCTDLKAETWYEFQKHRWVYIQSGHTLSKKISDEVSKEFLKIGITSMKAQCDDEDGIKGDDSQQNIKKFLNLSNKLKDHNYKKYLMKECAQKFYDPKFEEKLDSNIDLIGFENGVYDLKLHHFRNGVPDDYLKMSVGYDYKEYKENSDEIRQIMKYFETVQTDEKMRQYVLRFVASCLNGSTKNQKFFIWTGSGANGKSTTEKLIEYTFGEYYKTMPNEVMTRKSKAAGGPKPELADKRGVRIVFMNEPEGDDTLGVSKMKEFTGGEKTDARAPYGQLFYFKPQFKMVLCCNKLPTIMARDGGTWRRLRVTAWESKFVEYKPKKAKEFKVDPTLLENIAMWKEAFMWYIINIIYPQYEKYGLEEPPQVTEHTNKYKKDSDIYYEFLSEYTIREDGHEISCSELYALFKDWYRENYTNKYPVKKELVEYLSSIDLPPSQNIVTGLKMKLYEETSRKNDSV